MPKTHEVLASPAQGVQAKLPVYTPEQEAQLDSLREVKFTYTFQLLTKFDKGALSLSSRTRLFFQSPIRITFGRSDGWTHGIRCPVT